MDVVSDLLDGRPMVCNTLMLEKKQPIGGPLRHILHAADRAEQNACHVDRLLETPREGTGLLRYYALASSHKIRCLTSGLTAASPPSMTNTTTLTATFARSSARRRIQATIFQPGERRCVHLARAAPFHGGSQIQDYSNIAQVTRYLRQMEHPDVCCGYRRGTLLSAQKLDDLRRTCHLPWHRRNPRRALSSCMAAVERGPTRGFSRWSFRAHGASRRCFPAMCRAQIERVARVETLSDPLPTFRPISNWIAATAGAAATHSKSANLADG